MASHHQVLSKPRGLWMRDGFAGDLQVFHEANLTSTAFLDLLAGGYGGRLVQATASRRFEGFWSSEQD